MERATEHAKKPSRTKSGPGRYHQQGNGTKSTKQLRAGSYGRGLRNWIRNKQAAAMANRLAKRMAAP